MDWLCETCGNKFVDQGFLIATPIHLSLEMWCYTVAHEIVKMNVDSSVMRELRRESNVYQCMIDRERERERERERLLVRPQGDPSMTWTGE